MFFGRVLEWSLTAFVIIVLVTQVIMPLWRGRPLFPLFRRQRKLEQKLAEAHASVDEAELERDIGKITKQRKRVASSRRAS